MEVQPLSAKPAEALERSEREDEVNVLELLLVLLRHKKRILLATFGGALLALVVSLLLPNRYMATTKILAPQQQNQSLISSLLGLGRPNDFYVAILKSRTVQDALIHRFYREKDISRARQELEGASTINLGKDGFISISVEDTNPKRAAELANAYVDELRNVTIKLTTFEARQELIGTQAQLGPLEKQSGGDIQVATGKVPEAGLKSVRAVRDVQRYETIFEVLAKRYEAVKFDESRAAAAIRVLDPAVEPDGKSSPQRTAIVVAAALSACFLSCVWTLIEALIACLRSDPEQRGKLEQIRGYLL